MNKFNAILENFITNHNDNSNTISIRDIVKFIPKYKSSEFYKNSLAKEQIDYMAKGEYPIRVLNIKSKYPTNGNSVVNDNSRGFDKVAEIAIEYAPHRTDNSKSITVPVELLIPVLPDAPNMVKLSNKFDKRAQEYNKKFEDTMVKNIRNQSEVNGKLHDVNLNLPTKNIKISNSDNGKVETNIVSDNTTYSESPLMESYIEELKA